MKKLCSIVWDVSIASNASPDLQDDRVVSVENVE